MPKRGQLNPGGLASRVLALVAEGQGAAVTRSTLGERLPAPERRWLARTLAALQGSGLIAAAADGFRLADAPAQEPAVVERVAPPLPEHYRKIIAELVRRAHGLRATGIVVGAAELLRAAADKVSDYPAAQDIAALADLFEHAPSLYPTLDLPARAAA